MLSDAWKVVALLLELLSGAPRETRTPDPLITNQISYILICLRNFVFSYVLLILHGLLHVFNLL